MSKVFSEQKSKSPKPLRNGYDHSNQVLITGNYGDLMVVNVEDLNPGESIRIEDTVAIRSHPVVFPVQTRMKAYLHYFAVRNRILCDDWENFITGLDPNASLPYINYSESQGKRLMKTGTLMDHLGVPTTVGGDYPANLVLNIKPMVYALKNPTSSFNDVDKETLRYIILNSSFDRLSSYVGNVLTAQILAYGYHLDLTRVPLSVLPEFFYSDVVSAASSPSFSNGYILLVALVVDDNFVAVGDMAPIVGGDRYSSKIPDAIIDAYNNALVSGFKTIGLSFILSFYLQSDQNVSFLDFSNYNTLIKPFFGDVTFQSRNYVEFPLDHLVQASLSQEIESTDDLAIASNIFLSHNGNAPAEPLSALYPRAYEMIYNYYYRNTQNNPYNPTGSKVEYNKFIPSTASGADSNEYVLHRRNWELDPYTSAVPSPQFGEAPLVGISYTGGNTADFVFEISDENGVQHKVKSTLRVGESGVLEGIQSFDQDVPSGNLRNLMDLTTYGISINSIRNANAFQLFLEDTFSHPLRYRDQIYGHYGVSVDYPDVDVPEFIGGTSGELIVSQVTNQSESDNAPLGDIAGKIDAVFKMNYPVKYHAKEHTIILGILSIVPVPTYSQLLPKRFTKFSMFDFFQRRFGKIGYVPIFRSELFPLQSSGRLDEVFGYQRAWYEYMSKVNEVHGDFRTSLSDFVLMRKFKDAPSLNANFTVVDPDSLTNIFQTDKILDKYGSSDKFMIQVYHDSSYLSIIPRYARASLE